MLTEQQKKTIENVKKKQTILKQIEKLQKEVATLRKKMEAKEEKISQLISQLEDENIGANELANSSEHFRPQAL